MRPAFPEVAYGLQNSIRLAVCLQGRFLRHCRTVCLLMTSWCRACLFRISFRVDMIFSFPYWPVRSDCPILPVRLRVSVLEVPSSFLFPLPLLFSGICSLSCSYLCSFDCDSCCLHLSHQEDYLLFLFLACCSGDQKCQ